MRVVEGLAVLASLTACGQAPPGPIASVPPTDDEIALACGQPEHDAREAAMKSPGPEVPTDWIAAHWAVRGSSCALEQGRVAACRFEIAPILLEAGPADRAWKPARGRFRFLGNRVAYSRWYPVDDTACRGRGG